MNDGLIPQRYAKALYKFALEKGNTAAVYDEIKEVIKSFEANPSLPKVLSNPFVDRKDKENLLLSAAGSKVEDSYRRFVTLILDNNREDYAYGMALAFRHIYREANKISEVKITTASSLPDEELNKIRNLVSGSFRDSVLEFNHKIDPTLIGGFVVDVDSVRMDASLSNEFEQLRNNLITSNY